jgi:hypothetical protein
MKRTLILAIASLLFATGLFAQAPHGVDLSWSWAQGTGSPGTGFNVKRATVTGGPYSILTTTPAAIASRAYSDTSGTGNVLTEGATYFYVLTTIGNCKDANGVITVCESVPSPEVSAKIPFYTVPAPNPPTGLSASGH